MSPAHNRSPAVGAVLAALDAGDSVDRTVLATAVRALLAALVERAPGRTVEVRIPPYGAIQCGEGPRHTRGTPPNVVEMDPMTWISVATGRLGWTEAVSAGRIQVSGARSDISPYLPL
ncbi:MAG TPA: sterol carrier family protein [Micromonosporaceae bacterium]|nr:sterol carrier family protein [Micromonosporaceae bacterium]